MGSGGPTSDESDASSTSITTAESDASSLSPARGEQKEVTCSLLPAAARYCCFPLRYPLLAAVCAGLRSLGRIPESTGERVERPQHGPAAEAILYSSSRACVSYFTTADEVFEKSPATLLATILPIVPTACSSLRRTCTGAHMHVYLRALNPFTSPLLCICRQSTYIIYLCVFLLFPKKSNAPRGGSVYS